MRPAVFLDRDNTLIANDGDLGDPHQVQLLDGVATGLRALHDAGYELVVVTNQAGVARGVFTEDDVDEVHQQIDRLVEQATESSGLITRFYYCPYHPEAPLKSYRRDHPWRKPNPGMLIQASRDLDLDLARSWMIGDHDRDITAGRSAGCRTVLLGAAASANGAAPTLTATSFAEAVQAVLSRTPPGLRDRESAPPSPPGQDALRSAIVDLADELRSERAQRNDFTPMRLAAGLAQLGALLLALLGLLQLDVADVYLKWMAGAMLVQLLVIALLVADQR